MAVEGTGVITVLASASNAFISLFKHGLHYVEIPEEVEQFRHAISNLENSINVSRRLRRVKSYYLDAETKREVDVTITRSEHVLDSISRTIEACRADLETKGTVSVKNRLDWLLRGHGAFMSRGMTLNTCLQCLSMQIARMDAMKPPVDRVEEAQKRELTPLSYRDSLSPEKQLLRPPSSRKLRTQQARFSTSSLVPSISERAQYCSTEKEVVVQQSQNANERGIGYLSVPVQPAFFSSTLSLPPSYHTAESVTGSTGCAGSNCTWESCSNHGGCGSADDQLTPSRSLDSGFAYSDWASISSPSIQTRHQSVPQPALPVRRKRNKSGLI